MLQIFSTNTYKREFIVIFGIQQNPCQSALSTSLSGRFALLLVWSINTHPTVYGPLQTLTLMIRDLKHDISCSCRTKGMRVQWGHITDRSPLSKKKKHSAMASASSSPFTIVALPPLSTRFSNLPPRTHENQAQLENLPSPSAHETTTLISSNSTATTSSSMPATLKTVNMNMQNINPTAGFFNNANFRETTFRFTQLCLLYCYVLIMFILNELINLLENTHVLLLNSNFCD